MRRRENLQMIFNNSTIIPFKWKANYICFYCGLVIVDYNELRRHTENHGECNLEEYAVKSIKGDIDMDIKIDISNVTCKLCNESLGTFNELIDHLGSVHNVKYDETDMVLEQYNLADLTCHLCSEKFNYFGYLASHMYNSHPTKCLTCDKCNQKFENRMAFFCHIKYYHREAGYQCDMCPRKFNTLNILRKHHSNTHQISCDVCNLKLPSAAAKLKHLRREHPQSGSPKCQNCNKIFSTKLGLKVHMKKCLASTPHKRKKTDSEVNYEDRAAKRNKLNKIKKDIINVINFSTAIPFSFYKNTFNCFYCGEDFTDSDTLREHTVLNHASCDPQTSYIKKSCKKIGNICVKLDISSLACKLCYESFKELDALIDHLDQKHDTHFESTIKSCLQPYRLIKDNMECAYCPGEVFQFFNMLLRHVNAKHTNNNVVCVHCGLTFGKESHLRLHTRNRHSEGQFRCLKCDAECHTRARLANHMASIHGVKAVKCARCGDRFSSQYLRQKHLLDVHNFGHKCPHCGKLFVRNSFMKNHVRRTHLKEKKVECSVCDMKFFNGVQLKYHMVKHVGEKIFHCDVCGERFKWRKGLVRHMARHKNAVTPLML